MSRSEARSELLGARPFRPYMQMMCIAFAGCFRPARTAIFDFGERQNSVVASGLKGT